MKFDKNQKPTKITSNSNSIYELKELKYRHSNYY